MKNMFGITTLCVALMLIVSACRSGEEAAKASLQSGEVQTIKLTSAPPAAPKPAVYTPIVVTSQMIDSCTDKALAANNDTERSARHIKVTATKKDIAGTTVTFAKGDTYWGLCKAALSDPQATQLAIAKAKSASLTAKVTSLDNKVAALNADYTKVDDERKTAKAALAATNSEIAKLQLAINSRTLAKTPPATSTANAPATTPSASQKAPAATSSATT